MRDERLQEEEEGTSLSSSPSSPSQIRTQPLELMVQSPPQNPRVTQSPLMFAPQPPTQSSLHPIKKEKIVSSSSSSAYPKQDMFLFLNPRGQYDFTKTHLQSKELPDMNYASNTRKRSTFLERCVSKRKYCALAVSSDGRYLATRGVDHHVHIWDVHTREHVHVHIKSNFCFVVSSVKSQLFMIMCLQAFTGFAVGRWAYEARGEHNQGMSVLECKVVLSSPVVIYRFLVLA
ncbi:hypothetical protein F2Q70_00000387 [Brassica cretica]|uniref:Uncharacterized protein n=1 Tax=Brassica cretica TaxID=69181 RepID=A0A8S9IN48_BRACR|nr:hypothetical protein F2Q70_00000387 [Brassica cretica]